MDEFKLCFSYGADKSNVGFIQVSLHKIIGYFSIFSKQFAVIHLWIAVLWVRRRIEYLEDNDDTFLRNVGNQILDYTV